MSSATSASDYNVRVLSQRQEEELEAEMARVGSEWPGIVRMAPKAESFVVKVSNLRNPAILILKESFLSKGGDCAIHRDAITHRIDRSDCLLIGTYRAFTQVIADLKEQAFELPRVANEIQFAIDSFRSKTPGVPNLEGLPKPIRTFYSELRKRTLIMGILNVTPDSFSDGGLHNTPDLAAEHALRMVQDGADVIDIGGESTRPGSDTVTAEEEIARVVTVIRALSAQVEVPISIDTFKPEVARAALDVGASIINDITGMADPRMRILAAERKVPSIVMHMRGIPQTMQEHVQYDDLISEIMLVLRQCVDAAVEAGLPKEFLIIDPGIGFAKTAEQNMEIIRKLADFRSLGLPILMGTSRKAFIGKVLGGVPANERVEGTAATVALSIANGANIVRVHDVCEMSKVARVCDAIIRSQAAESSGS